MATTARAIAPAITPHGSWNGPITWWALASTRGRYASHAASPMTAPSRVPATPTTSPLARTTRRTFLSVAPTAPSMPSERSRRCASTVKPPMATRAIRSMPIVASPSTMVSGLNGLLAAAEARLSTVGPMEEAFTPGALNSTTTWVGAVTWPGTTRANSSRRLCGFSTMPVTRQALPSWCQTSPTLRPNVAATPSVTATWPGLVG